MVKTNISINSSTGPDYKRIFLDILQKKYPHKIEEYEALLATENLSILNIINLNESIFDKDKESEEFNQKLRSYNKSDILQILDFQKKHNLNNTQLARHFKLSRNTVAKWKKIFLV